MHPVDSVFAIGGDDDSEQDEDLLAQGARRLGALAAAVSPTAEASSNSKGSPDTAAAATAISDPSFAASAPSSAAAVECSLELQKGSLDPQPGRSAGNKLGSQIERWNTGAWTGQQQPSDTDTKRKESASSSSSRALHRSSGVADSTAVYRPEVDGPPIIG